MILTYCRQFKMGGLTDDFDRILIEAEKSAVSYLDYTLELFKAEAGHRERRNLERRLKVAGLPFCHDLNAYDHGFDNGLQKSRISQLRELNWLAWPHVETQSIESPSAGVSVFATLLRPRMDQFCTARLVVKKLPGKRRN